eukprot:m.765000 g.765000  ORF g.765000 m.765000 type:complete len:1052 (+) comp23218_c0_seq1:212-3367(+)
MRTTTSKMIFVLQISFFFVGCVGLRRENRHTDGHPYEKTVSVHRRQDCNDTQATGFYGSFANGTMDDSRSLTCQELFQKNSCNHPELGSIVRYQCPITCGADCSEETPQALLEISNTTSAGGGFRNVYIVIIVLLIVILVMVIILYVRAGRRGKGDLAAIAYNVDMTSGRQHRRSSKLFDTENETIALENMAYINSSPHDYDVSYGNNAIMRTQASVKEASFTTAPADFGALSEIKDSYITDSKLRELKAGFDQLISTIYDDEEFDLENDDAIESVILESFDEAQLSLLVEYDDLLEHFDVEDLNTTMEMQEKQGAASPTIGRIRANSVASFEDIPDTKMSVRDFLAKVVEALRRDNLCNPERARFWAGFAPLLRDYIVELKTNEERLTAWRSARSVQYNELFEQFFNDGYCDSEPLIDSLIENLSETIEDALAAETPVVGDGVATLRRKSAATAIRTNRWKNSSFWVHVRLMLDEEGNGRVPMKSFLVYLTEECLDNITMIEDNNESTAPTGANAPLRRGPRLSLEGMLSPTDDVGESTADGEPEAEQTSTSTAGKESPGKVRKLARMRSVAPPPDEEPDLLHPTRVDLATGRRQPSINENQRISRLVASLKKYLGLLQWATAESDDGMLPADAAEEYIPQCFNDLQQNFRVKIADLEEKLGFIYSDTAADSDGQILSVWTKWAWASFWVKVKLDLDSEGDGRVKVHTFLSFLTEKIRAAHKTAVTRHDGSVDRKLARSGSIIYMSSSDLEAQAAARVAMEEASSKSKTKKERRQERMKQKQGSDGGNPTYIGSFEVKDSKKKSRGDSDGKNLKRSDQMAVVNDLYDNADCNAGEYATVRHDGMQRASSASSFAESASMETKGLTPQRVSQERIYQMPQDAKRVDEYGENGLYGEPQDAAPAQSAHSEHYSEPQDGMARRNADNAYSDAQHEATNSTSVEYDSIRSDAIVVGDAASDQGYRQAVESNPEYREAMLAAADDEPAYSTVHVVSGVSGNGSMRRDRSDDFVAYTDVNVAATILYNQQQREQSGAVELINEGYDDDEAAGDQEA